ncbi:MAG: hypothetical protein HFJ30_10445 [Clostridia bacterium]|jgi:hypothetical protein|nr:hypothetical protein [Clostridia bacterium]
MKEYTNYEFYKDTYKGNMPKDDFDILVIRASTEVRNAIMNRDISNYEDEVQLATCSVTDILLKIEQIESKKSKLVSSEKADRILASEQVADLSRTYADATKLSDLDLEISNQQSKIREEIERQLLFTGLLNRRCEIYGRCI